MCVLIGVAAVMIYCVLYAIRFLMVNRAVAEGGVVMLTSLPGEFHQYVLYYNDEEILKDTNVLVQYFDIDGDGTTEVIMDSGSNERGASHSWYVVLEHQKDGTYRKIGAFYCDEWFFLPRFTIRGKPDILVNWYGGWTIVRWEGTHYSDIMPKIVK